MASDTKKKIISKCTKRIVITVTEEQFWAIKSEAYAQRRTVKAFILAPALKQLKKKETA